MNSNHNCDTVLKQNTDKFTSHSKYSKNLGLFHMFKYNSGAISSESNYKCNYGNSILLNKYNMKTHKILLNFNDFDNLILKNTNEGYYNQIELLSKDISNWLLYFLYDKLNLAYWEKDSLYFDKEDQIIASIKTKGIIWHLISQKPKDYKNPIKVNVDIVHFRKNNTTTVKQINISIEFTNIKMKSICYNDKNIDSYEPIIRDFIQENFYSKFKHHFISFNSNSIISHNWETNNNLWEYCIEDREVQIYRLNNILCRKFLNFYIIESNIDSKIIISFTKPFSLSPKKYVLKKGNIISEINEILKITRTSYCYNELPSKYTQIKLMSCSKCIWHFYNSKIKEMIMALMNNDIPTSKSRRFLQKYYKKKQNLGFEYDEIVIQSFFKLFINVTYTKGDIYVSCWMESQLEYIETFFNNNLLVNVPVMFDNHPILMKSLQNAKTIYEGQNPNTYDINTFYNIIELWSIMKYIMSINTVNNLNINTNTFIPNIVYDNESKETTFQLLSFQENVKELEEVFQNIHMNMNCYNCQDRISSVKICSKCSICLECFNDYISQPIDFDCFCGCNKKIKSFDKQILSNYILSYLNNNIIEIINKQYQSYKESLIPLINPEESQEVENKVLEIRDNINKYPEYKIEDDQILTGCLNCGYMIIKEEGCNAMKCQKCSSEFCAKCMVPRKQFPCKCSFNDPSHFSITETATSSYFEDEQNIFPIDVSRQLGMFYTERQDVFNLNNLINSEIGEVN